MEILIANIAGKTRKVTKGGREYIVAPVTMIVPGVLNGSKGPLFYPPEEISRDPASWNGMPIVVYHPVRNGNPVSARDPDVLEVQGIGTVYNAQYNDKLAAEGWFDVEATRKVDSRVLNALEAGQPIELSTGLFTENEPAPEGSVTSNGVAYSYIARNYRPDHLAILPDQVGACSLKDGCGVLVNENKADTLLQKLMRFVGFKDEPTSNELSHDQLRDQLSTALRGRFTQSDPGAWINEVFDGYIIYSQGEKMYKLAYSKSDTGVTLSDSAATEVVREVNYVTSNSEDPSMKLTAEQRQQIVDQLIANCGDCGWTEQDRTSLQGLTDASLKGMADKMAKQANATAVANAAKQGAKELEPQPTVNAQPVTPVPTKPQTTEEWMASAPAEVRAAVQNAMAIQAAEKTQLVEKLTANLQEPAKAGAVAVYNAMGLEQLRALAAAVPAPVAPVTYPPVTFGGLAAPVTAPVTNAAPRKGSLIPPQLDFSQKQ